jgi:hypothetical protein
LDFGWFTSCREVRRPKCRHRLLALRRERCKITAFKSTKAERYGLQREAMLLAKMRGKLVGAC